MKEMHCQKSKLPGLDLSCPKTLHGSLWLCWYCGESFEHEDPLPKGCLEKEEKEKET